MIKTKTPIYILLTFSLLLCFGNNSFAQKKKNLKEKISLSEKKRLQLASMFIDANKEKALGNYEVSAALFQKCLELDKNNAASAYELSKIYLGGSISRTGINKDLLNKSLQLAEKAVKEDETNIWYKELLAQIYDVKGDDKNILKTYDELIVLDPKNVEYYSAKATVFERQKDYNKAIETYNKIEEILGINASTSFKKSKQWFMLKKEDKSINEIEKLISAFPQNTDYYQKLAEIHMLNDNENKVIETYERLKKVDPENGQIHLYLYEMYIKKNEPENAYKEAQLLFQNELIDIDKKVKIALNYYILTEKDSSYKPKTEELIDLLMTVNPDEAKSFAIAGDYYLREQQKERALNYFITAVNLDQNRYPIWTQVFLTAAELNKHDTIIALGEQCKEFFPNQPTPYYFKGISLLQLNKNEAAIEELVSGKNMVYDNLPLLMQFNSLLGDAYNNTKQYKKSDEAYESVLALDSNNIQVLNNYAYYLSVRKEKLNRALEMSKKTVDYDSESSTFADTYGWIFYQMKQYNEAEKWIKKSIELGGDNSGIIVEHLGDIYFQQNKIELAIQQWKKALKLGGTTENLEKKIKDKKLYE